jgi:hypothetical protein
MANLVGGSTPKWKIVVAWLVVLIPFLWGITDTLRSSLRLLGH